MGIKTPDELNSKSRSKATSEENKLIDYINTANRKLNNILMFHQLELQNQGLIFRAEDEEGPRLVGS